MRRGLTRRRVARAAIVGLMLSGLAVPLAAQAMPAPPPDQSDRGIPALVDPAADLAARTPGPENTWVDSIFIAGQVHGGGHDFAILVHTSRFPNAPQYSYYASVADTTTGWYRNFQTPIAPGDYQWSQTGLHIEMPGLLWTGNAREMQLTATTPWGSLTARFTPTGPVLNYSGNAIVPLLDDVDYEYAFPTMRTTGTLTAEGRNFRISGSSWLDRQWGPVPLTVTSRWTWMNLGLSNGDQLALWDIVDAPAEHAWVTVLHPDGSYDLAAVTPVADGASDFWTSPATGKTYPMRWRVEIPSLRTRLDVRVAGPKGQEFPNGHVEATATVSGRAEGGRVSGTTFIEMAGAWTEHH